MRRLHARSPALLLLLAPAVANVVACTPQTRPELRGPSDAAPDAPSAPDDDGPAAPDDDGPHTVPGDEIEPPPAGGECTGGHGVTRTNDYADPACAAPGYVNGFCYNGFCVEPLAEGVVDNDFDGFSDDDELLMGTDPANADTDGDGFDDSTDFLFGYDPLDPDIDDDGITDGEDLNSFAGGKTDSDGDGVGDIEETDVLSLDPTEPDLDHDGLLDGAEIVDMMFGWRTDPYKPDTDFDGQLDGEDDEPWTMFPDSDGDWLADEAEEFQGTDPFNPDSDGDGLDDYHDLYDCFSPLDADSNNDGVRDGDETPEYILDGIPGPICHADL